MNETVNIFACLLVCVHCVTFCLVSLPRLCFFVARFVSSSSSSHALLFLDAIMLSPFAVTQFSLELRA